MCCPRCAPPWARRPSKRRASRSPRPVEVKAPLAFYMPVKLKSDDWGRTSAEPRPTNGSGDFTALAGTDGFVELPPGPNTFPKGFVARFFRW